MGSIHCLFNRSVPNQPVLDLSQIEFPSDLLTIKQLREDQPRAFTVEAFSDARAGDYRFIAMMDGERVLAERAFTKEAGLIEPRPFYGDREEIVHLLNTDYVRMGISAGLQQTRQMIRKFEAVAITQARSQLGQSR